MELIDRAKRYLAMNAAESGADVLITELADEVERLRVIQRMNDGLIREQMKTQVALLQEVERAGRT